MNWYVMTSNGMGTGSWVPSFGPFRDLSNARLAANMLGKRGVAVKVCNEAEAKEADVHGVNVLKIKHPNGIQW